MSTVLWGGLAYTWETSVTAFEQWKADKAAELHERDVLWQLLNDNQRVRFLRFLEESRGKPLSAESHTMVPKAEVLTTAPSVTALPHLRRFAISEGLANPAEVKPAVPTESFGWSWLPIKSGTSDELRLTRLQNRLREINEVLGEKTSKQPRDAMS